MYSCMHAYPCASIRHAKSWCNTQVCTYTYIYIYVYLYICTYIHNIYRCICILIYVYMYIYIYTVISTCTYRFINIYIIYIYMAVSCLFFWKKEFWQNAPRRNSYQWKPWGAQLLHILDQITNCYRHYHFSFPWLGLYFYSKTYSGLYFLDANLLGGRM